MRYRIVPPFLDTKKKYLKLVSFTLGNMCALCFWKTFLDSEKPMNFESRKRSEKKIQRIAKRT